MLKATALAFPLALASLPLMAEAPALLKQAEASRVTYDLGVEQRDPLLVIAAAKMRRGLSLEPTDRVAEGGEAGDEGLLDFGTMMSTARDFAAGDGMLIGLIEDVEAEASKGVTIGPVYNIARISGGRTDTYKAVPFDGGAYAEIYVEAKSNADLNLRIYDAQNRLVCSDTDASAIAYCGWKPRKSGNFTIAVENASGSSVQYSLITN